MHATETGYTRGRNNSTYLYPLRYAIRVSFLCLLLFGYGRDICATKRGNTIVGSVGRKRHVVGGAAGHMSPTVFIVRRRPPSSLRGSGGVTLRVFFCAGQMGLLEGIQLNVTIERVLHRHLRHTVV